MSKRSQDILEHQTWHEEELIKVQSIFKINVQDKRRVTIIVTLLGHGLAIILLLCWLFSRASIWLFFAVQTSMMSFIILIVRWEFLNLYNIIQKFILKYDLSIVESRDNKDTNITN